MFVKRPEEIIFFAVVGSKNMAQLYAKLSAIAEVRANLG
jgi:hypothetical protein